MTAGYRRRAKPDAVEGIGRRLRARVVATPGGPARVHLTVPAEGTPPCGLLCLGHGAGGGVDAPDLLAVASAAVAAGWSVARIEQPYRVAGRRAPDRAPRLDEAWCAVLDALRTGRGRAAAGTEPDVPVVTGGRSSGARVACRTAERTGVDGVVCLAFPLHPPRRPEVSRLDELLAVRVPCLVVQGERDPFGTPAAFPPGVTVVGLPGDHSLRRSAPEAAAAVVAWLGQRVA